MGMGTTVIEIYYFNSHKEKYIELSGRKAVRWPGVPKVARSHLSQCSKSCDLQPALNCAIRGA